MIAIQFGSDSNLFLRRYILKRMYLSVIEQVSSGIRMLKGSRVSDGLLVRCHPAN